MTIDKIAAVRAELNRFERALKALSKQRETDAFSGVGTRAGGAARRASLDLTRALADFRRPNA